MQDWWRDNGPPVYMSVAGYLGLIKSSKKEVGDLEDLEAQMAGGF